MTEYIEREQLIGELKDVIAVYKDEHTFSTDFAATIVTDILDNIVKCQPAADVSPVVRCRDCAVPHNKHTGCPKLNGLVTTPDFYCPFGERKDGVWMGVSAE